jgi:hypothetical protein
MFNFSAILIVDSLDEGKIPKKLAKVFRRIVLQETTV